MRPSPHDPATSEASAAELRGLLARFVLGLAGLMGVLLLVGYAFRQQLMAVSHGFVDHFGGPGLMLVFFIPDAFTVPLPQDAFLAFALLGGLSFWHVVAWAFVGSFAGGMLGFLLARQLRRTRWYERFRQRRGGQAERLARRYGPLALAFGAITPLPYSIMCWTCGALGMPLSHFAAVSLLRIVRVSGYLWLIELGVLHIVR